MEAGDTTQQLKALTVFCRGPRFGPQNPHGSSQHSLTPVSGASTSSEGSKHSCGVHTCMEAKYIHTLKTNIFKKRNQNGGVAQNDFYRVSFGCSLDGQSKENIG